MKKVLKIFLSFALVLFVTNLFGQIAVTKTDTIYIQQDTLVLRLDNHRGDLLWQYSKDLTTWNTVSNTEGDSLVLHHVDSGGYYRAKIVYGTCDPVYSDTTIIVYTTPTIETLPVSLILKYSAVLNGSIVFDGGSSITESGFYICKNKDSIASGIKILSENNVQKFNATISDLEPATNYFICAYAINNVGTIYGDTVSFKTDELEMIAFDLRNDSLGWDSWAIARDGSNFFVNFNGQKPASVYFQPDIIFDGYSIFFSDNGLPSKMVVDSTIYLFDNYRDGLFDIALILPNGYIQIYRDVQNGIDLSRYSLKSLKSSQSNDWLLYGLETAGQLIGVVTCVTGLLALPTGVGTIPGAALVVAGCSATVLSLVTDALLDDYSFLGLSANTASGIFDIIDCAGGDVMACATSIAGSALGITQEAIIYSDDNDDVATADELLVSDEGTFTDRRDGNTYNWVTIGDQTWMAENLAYLPYYIYEWSDDEPRYYAGISNETIYGIYYNYAAAEDACPAGWHLPEQNEWITLIEFLGGTSTAGGKMKSTAVWNSPNSGATNISGFSALPAGLMNSGHVYQQSYGYGCYWWSTDFCSGTGFFSIELRYDSSSISSYCASSQIEQALTIRCVKN